MSQQVYEVAETKISAGPSRITRPAELNEIVQYIHIFEYKLLSVVSIIPTESKYILFTLLLIPFIIVDTFIYERSVLLLYENSRFYYSD